MNLKVNKNISKENENMILTFIKYKKTLFA